MSTFGPCKSSCPPTGTCNLDAAVVEILSDCSLLGGLTHLYSAGAAGAARSQTAASYPRVFVELGSPGAPQYHNETTWSYDAPLNFLVYTHTPGQGVQLAGAIMQVIIEAERIDFAFGSACVFRPALPRQRDLGKLVVETSFTLQATIHQQLGSWCD